MKHGLSTLSIDIIEGLKFNTFRREMLEYDTFSYLLKITFDNPYAKLFEDMRIDAPLGFSISLLSELAFYLTFNIGLAGFLLPIRKRTIRFT